MRWLWYLVLVAACLTVQDVIQAECRGRCVARGFYSGIIQNSQCYCLDREKDFQGRIKMGQIMVTPTRRSDDD